MNALAPAVLWSAAAWWMYTYAGYPLLLALLSLGRRRPPRFPVERGRWPSISISFVVYNEAATIAATLERLLALDYPVPRRQILVVSDGSTDETDAIIRSFAPRGVELLRLGERHGKTAAENIAARQLRGDIIVNTDATVRVDAAALKALVREFDDPTVGVASGRDVSIASGNGHGAHGTGSTRAEGAYVGYEMWVRELETRVSGIVGASGCLYAARADVQKARLPGGVARDFAAPLVARGLGLRAVSARDAVCLVPRSTDLRREFRRKRRTIVRGLATIALARHLAGPDPGLGFTWMLWSHKLARWLAPWWALAAVPALLWIALRAGWGLAAVGAIVAAALVTLASPPLRFAIAGNVAVIASWVAWARGENPPVWEPTRRG